MQPKVSTEGRDLTIACKRAILLVPRAKHLNKHQLYSKEKHKESKYEDFLKKYIKFDQDWNKQ